MEKEPQLIPRLLHIGAVKRMVVTEPGVRMEFTKRKLPGGWFDPETRDLAWSNVIGGMKRG